VHAPSSAASTKAADRICQTKDSILASSEDSAANSRILLRSAHRQCLSRLRVVGRGSEAQTKLAPAAPGAGSSRSTTFDIYPAFWRLDRLNARKAFDLRKASGSDFSSSDSGHSTVSQCRAVILSDMALCADKAMAAADRHKLPVQPFGGP
jgi:hypothetical protein